MDADCGVGGVSASSSLSLVQRGEGGVRGVNDTAVLGVPVPTDADDEEGVQAEEVEVEVDNGNGPLALF